MLVPAISDIAPPVVALPGGLATLFQVVGVATSYGNEANPQTRVPYSKFFHEAANEKKSELIAPAQVTSRTGMTIIYGLPFAAAVLSQLIAQSITLAGILTAVHFAKRLLEVQFVHSYSGGMARNTGILIGTYYALVAVLICSLATGNPTEAAAIWGSTLFTVGSLGNLYHHILLARLRKSSNSESKSYSVPSGGLFEYAAAPHYLFELTAWLGIAFNIPTSFWYLRRWPAILPGELCLRIIGIDKNSRKNGPRIARTWSLFFSR